MNSELCLSWREIFSACSSNISVRDGTNLREGGGEKERVGVNVRDGEEQFMRGGSKRETGKRGACSKWYKKCNTQNIAFRKIYIEII